MGELSANRLWDIGGRGNDQPSKYARMIPGVSVMRGSKFKLGAHASVFSDETTQQNDAGSPKARPLAHRCFPQPGLDHFTLFKLIAADFAVVMAASAAPSLFFPEWSLPRAFIPIFASLVVLMGFSEGLYRGVVDTLSIHTVAILARSTFVAIGLVFIAASNGMRLRAAFATSAITLIGLASTRLLRHFARKPGQSDTEARKVLIVGGGPVARSIARALRNDPQQRTVVCGFVDDDLPLSPAVLGRIGDLEWLARSEFIDEVILALPGQSALMREAAEIAFRNHLDIRAVPDQPPGPWPDSNVDHIGEVPIITLHHEALPGIPLLLKRFLDATGALIGLVLLGPIIVIMALLIRLDSPGPAFYSAERTGAKGRRFRCYKLRSMVTAAANLKEELRAYNQRQGPIFKIENDPRITRIGRVIRRYSLDELPQLWNVLRGEMSLVGPRPHPVDEVNHYEIQHFRRLDVKPGITGLWQITARDCPSFELNMHLDLTYIENWSLKLDLRILAGTIRVLFAPEGA
jgi:exopolysaccharide biosynthesis polyprenyl glycosylphosphotransferase